MSLINKIQKSAALLAISVFFMSCNTLFKDIKVENAETFDATIDVLVPADTAISADIKSIMLIPVSNITVDYSFQTLPEKIMSREVDSLFMLDVLDASYERLARLLSDSPRFTEIIQWNNFEANVDKMNIPEICKSNAVDAVVYLKKCKATCTIIPENNTTYNPSISIYGYFIAIDIYSTWKIVDKNGTVVVSLPIQNRIKIPMTSFYPPLTSVTANDISFALDKIKFKSGETFAKYIAPTWKIEHRLLFAKGNKDLRVASNFCDLAQYDSAVMIWRKNVNHKKYSVAKHAQFNLIYGLELQGKLSEALDLATEYSKKYASPEGDEYVEKLNILIKNNEKITVQIGK